MGCRAGRRVGCGDRVPTRRRRSRRVPATRTRLAGEYEMRNATHGAGPASDVEPSAMLVACAPQDCQQDAIYLADAVDPATDARLAKDRNRSNVPLPGFPS